MKWADGCSAGTPDLDEQHKHLFERFVFVKETMASGGGWADTHAALVTLIAHFECCTAVEEALMQIHHYPECGRHIREHADLLLNLHAMKNASLATGLTEQMIGTAFAAMMKHHLAQDRRYARYVSRAGGQTREIRQ